MARAGVLYSHVAKAAAQLAAAGKNPTVDTGFCRVVDQTAEIGRKRSCAPHTGRTTPAIAENWSANDIASAPSISN